MAVIKNMESIDLCGVPLITALCYGTVELLKRLTDNPTFRKLLPQISALYGALLGVALWYCAPHLIAANTALHAALAGLCSGLSATGCNQILKKMKELLHSGDEANGSL